jgi:hypothetical protein
MSEEWAPIEPTPEPEITPNGHHVEGKFDLSSLVSEPVPKDSQEVFPNSKASKQPFSFRSMLGMKPKEKKVKPRKPTPAMPRSGLAGPLTNMYTGLGLSLSMVDRNCGQAIVESAEDCAQAWEELARRNPRVRRAILMLLETSDVTKIVIAHAPIMMAVASHHVPFVKEQQLKVVEMFANQGASAEEDEEE